MPVCEEAVYIFDTREKKNDHVKSYFDRHGIEYEVRKLDVGDYMIDGNDTISIDRKASIDELSTNMLYRADHARFFRVFRRTKDKCIKLIILNESNKYIFLPS